MKSVLVVLGALASIANAQNPLFGQFGPFGMQPNPFGMQPNPFAAMQFPMMYPNTFMFAQPQSQSHVHRSTRPVGPQGDEPLQPQANTQTAATVNTAPSAATTTNTATTATAATTSSSTGSETSTGSGLASELSSSLTSAIQSSASTLMGSLSSTGLTAAQSAHSLFVPPYSWMWRVALSAASTKYDGVDKIADVPELMNLITGYYLGSPDALAAAQAATVNPTDRFSLTSLSHLFQGPATMTKSETSDSSDATAGNLWSGNPGSFPWSSPPPADSATDPVEDPADNDDSNAGASSSGMPSIFANLLGAQPKPKPPPPSSMWDMMNSQQSHGSNPMAEQMIKMAGSQMGVPPALVNMAAPMIGSFI